MLELTFLRFLRCITSFTLFAIFLKKPTLLDVGYEIELDTISCWC